MKKIACLFPLFLAMMALFAGCGSSRSFSTRKYTAGSYVSHQHKPGKVTVHEQPEHKAGSLAKDEALTAKTPAATKPASPKEELAVAGKTALGITSPQAPKASCVPGAEKKAGVENKEAEAKVLKREAFRKYIANKTERKCLAYDDGDAALDPVALVSFVLGIIGLVLNILAISVIVATADYVFALLFIAGLVMGIIAVVFGTQGLRRNHKTNNGTINLVFSIIGTAFGAGAIITAFVFAFYTVILAISGL